MRLMLLVITTCFALASCQPPTIRSAAPEGEWISLFNGRDLNDWLPKFTNHPVGENVRDTFQVKDGLLVVSYDKYESFDWLIGHLFYKVRPFSHYWLRAEYRFTGHQVRDAPDWGWRNNGLMLHSQPPETMALDQDFPISVETRLLGGRFWGSRTTGNVCTPGTSVLFEGERSEEHCLASHSKTYRGDQWVLVEVEVQGSEIVRQYINGELVMEYGELQIDEPQQWHPNIELESGYIAIQAETHPTEFRRIELLNLDDES